ELELREIENKKILQVKILGSGSIIKYSSIDPFIPEKDTSSSFLKNFTGKYYSEELDASCYINVEDDKLILHRMRDENRLLFLTADTTLTVKDGCELQFKQENGKIIGFTFSTFRMRGIQYKKEGFS
ncbi:MAG: hypothetical protein OEZ01_12185, partial [Candidatus Heimdallarchaeota archaeon]|nr:hypothetical protein [Candidatus Heimdallarchaeota archaeon]